jgi:molybdate transport system ATP-binding protein
MKLRSLVTGAAVLALCASAALAATPTHNPRHHNNRLARSIAANEPAQPIAYSKLDAYLKASPAEKKNGNWGLDASTASTATTGPGSNASAMAPNGSSTATTSAEPAAESAPSSTPSANQPATPPPDNAGSQSSTPK